MHQKVTLGSWQEGKMNGQMQQHFLLSLHCSVCIIIYLFLESTSFCFPQVVSAPSSESGRLQQLGKSRTRMSRCARPTNFFFHRIFQGNPKYFLMSDSPRDCIYHTKNWELKNRKVPADFGDGQSVAGRFHHISIVRDSFQRKFWMKKNFLCRWKPAMLLLQIKLHRNLGVC